MYCVTNTPGNCYIQARFLITTPLTKGKAPPVTIGWEQAPDQPHFVQDGAKFFIFL